MRGPVTLPGAGNGRRRLSDRADTGEVAPRRGALAAQQRYRRALPVRRRQTQTKPVANAKRAANGVGGRAGFIQGCAEERKLADMGTGPDHLGRLTITPPAPGTGQLTLSEDGDHPFGYKLSTSSSSTGDITVTTNTTPPQQGTGGQFGATLPVEGDKVTVDSRCPTARGADLAHRDLGHAGGGAVPDQGGCGRRRPLISATH